MVKRISIKFFSALLVLTLIVIVISVTLQIVFRYVFGSPLAWTSEIAMMAFCWFAFIGSALASYEKSHLEVSFVYNIFPPQAKKVIDFITYLMVFIFSCIIIYYSSIHIYRIRHVRSTVTGFPRMLTMIGICLGFIGIAYYTFLLMLNVRKEDRDA